MAPDWFLWFLVGFHGFSRWFRGFSWFLVGLHDFSRGFMVFHGFWLVSMVYKVVSWFLVGFNGISRYFQIRAERHWREVRG